jgi:hypothetical protein
MMISFPLPPFLSTSSPSFFFFFGFPLLQDILGTDHVAKASFHSINHLEDCCVGGTSCDKNIIPIVLPLPQNCEHSIEGHRKDSFN